MNLYPFVSVVIPCRNEGEYIAQCIDSVIANNYPRDKIEIFIIDGMSTDNSMTIVESYKQRYNFIKSLDNEKKITPCAFNLGVKSAVGEIIIILGAHASYPNNYIKKCVTGLLNYGADNVGGVLITRPQTDSLLASVIAKSLSSKFGVGNSVFRTGVESVREVDTVFGGCYKKEVFEKIGLFNEKLVSSQDVEFNKRLKKCGGKIILIPDIVAYYYTRTNLLSFIKNNFRNGKWAVLPFAYSEAMPVSLRHLVPMMFVSTLLVSYWVGLKIVSFKWLFWLIVISYLVVNIAVSIRNALKEKSLAYLFTMFSVFAMLHVGYGIGSLYGTVKMLTLPEFWKKMIKRKGELCGT